MPLIPQPTREQKPWILSYIPQTFVLRILNPTQVLFVGKVKAFASQNRMGQFDVLPGHTNIISIIYKRLIIYPEIGQPKEFDIDTGILRFINNSCELYLGIETSEVMKSLPQFDFAQIDRVVQGKIDQQQKVEVLPA